MGINNLLELYYELKRRNDSGGLLGLNYRETAILQYVEEQIYNQITPKAAVCQAESAQQAKVYVSSNKY